MSLNSESFNDYYSHLKDYTQIVKNGNDISLSICIDTVKHQYLCDHVFGGMCFIPATMIMELLMEAALWYTREILKKDDFFPVGLDDINIERALTVAKGEAIQAVINFQKVVDTNGEIAVYFIINSERKSATGEKVGTRINTTAKVILAKEYPATPSVDYSDAFTERYNIPQDVFYREYFPSLGFLFNSCIGKIAFDREQRIFCGVYNCNSKEKEFIKNDTSAFLSSPLGNDSCLQYAVFFSRILALKGRLPIGGRELRMFKKHPVNGEVKVFIKCIHLDDDIMIFDFYSFDETSLIALGKEFKVKKSPYHKELSRQEFELIMNLYKEE
ncbi:polyketide synthase dehydratase domain-containing protein [Ruminiclostridium cellulolyticum]|uniref:PKS/mFAS DH domain-containing protein n=1 Tax=Ruminiclostridium cellulolyticum (strain ATCC 35319 / DSM 5812 / JCM 6584 / H10) TaxID=394503 RepID=B8I8K8_RUMCH|nr:polyketide synthase dehydratase domain-containing protein [Ruminiclostridium cellulolyticum]ACL75241.1 hypothetical protein Ccel_0869 [Ruminiclostridium cellulolyticum H10]